MSESEIFEQMNDEIEDLKKERDALRAEVKRLTEERNFWAKDAETWQTMVKGYSLEIKRLEEEKANYDKKTHTVIDAFVKLNSLFKASESGIGGQIVGMELWTARTTGNRLGEITEPVLGIAAAIRNRIK
jgi:predicted nuclease with TOPRIM domain